MKAQSLEFWEGVLRDFSASEDDYLCHSSPEFKEEWGNKEFCLRCRDLVIKFLIHNGANDELIVEYQFDFNSCVLIGLGILLDYVKQTRREFRLAFLNWVVQQLAPNDE